MKTIKKLNEQYWKTGRTIKVRKGKHVGYGHESNEIQ